MEPFPIQKVHGPKAEYTDQVSGKSKVSFNAADLLLTKEDAKK